MVCVRKHDGDLRLCIDYRELNRRTVPDHFPLPKVQKNLEALSGSQYFSLLDQGKAYHQCFVKPECRHVPAFITPCGLVRVGSYTIRPHECPRGVSKVYAECTGEDE